MTKSAIREVLNAQPFRPVVLCLSDGRNMTVQHPEYLFVPPDKAEDTVILAREGGGFSLINIGQITSIERPPKQKKAA